MLIAITRAASDTINDCELTHVAREPSADETPTRIIRTILPDLSYQETESYERTVQQVRAAIERLDRQDRVRNRVRRLFDELVLQIETHEEIPPVRELARRLGVPSSTVWDGMETLRSIIQALKGRE